MRPETSNSARETNVASPAGYLLPPVAVLLVGAALAAFALARDVGARGEREAMWGRSVSTSVQRAVAPIGALSHIFRPEVMYWADAIIQWSTAAGLDPNLAAVVMQIESCGDPAARSRSGALGLFQVMPYHFGPGEDGLDPDTNARRGLDYLARSLEASGNDPRRAFAGYNGGISVLSWHEAAWSEQTQRYVHFGWRVYQDAQLERNPSTALEAWYSQFGASLCRQAASRLGID